jgi:hypothetical protein
VSFRTGHLHADDRSDTEGSSVTAVHQPTNSRWANRQEEPNHAGSGLWRVDVVFFSVVVRVLRRVERQGGFHGA